MEPLDEARQDFGKKEVKPKTKAPETKAPETKAPETKAPETKAPEPEVNKELSRIEAAQTGTYLPVMSERKHFHVRLEKPAFNPTTGQRLSKPFIQKFTIADWNHFQKNSKTLGYTTEIMWDPIKYFNA